MSIGLMNQIFKYALAFSAIFVLVGAAIYQKKNQVDYSSVPDLKNVTQVKSSQVLPLLDFAFPEVITWSIPTGASQHKHVLDGTIRPVVKAHSGVYCQATPLNCCELECYCDQRTPHSVVNKLVNLYASYGNLYGEFPAIFLQAIGMGNGDPCPQPGAVQHWMFADALFLNWCDQIKPDENDPCAPPSHESARWLSPWNDNGIELLKNWISGFLTSYQYQVSIGAIPVPERFVFDTEYWPMAPYWGENGIIAFRDLAGLNAGEEPDARWDTIILPVFDKTLKQLYDEAIVDGMTPPIPGNWAIEENRSWVVWYDQIMLTMCDSAMKEAFFDPIKDVWPDVICSNFDTSISADGLQSIPGSPIRVFRNRRHESSSWYTLVQKGSSDEQAAEMYCVSELHLQPNEEPGLAWSRVHRANIEACTESFDGYTIDKIMPWIPLIGTAFRTGWNGEFEYPDKWSVRNLLGMFRSKGISKFFVFSTNASDTLQNWEEFDDLIDQVWLTELTNYSVNVGNAEIGANSKLLLSDWNWKETHDADVLSIFSENIETVNKITCNLQFSTGFNCSQTRDMQLMIDGRLEGDLVELSTEARLNFSIQNTMTGEWSPLDEGVVDLMWFDMYEDKWIWEVPEDSGSILIDQRRVVIHLPIPLSRYWIDDGGEVNIRLSVNSDNQFTLLLDSATLFETDELEFNENCLADCAPSGGDGIVDLNDLLFVISEFNLGSSKADVHPVCGDGVVDIQDILSIFDHYLQSCQ